MNKGYWIALYKKIEDTSNLGNYAKKATETIIKHGGKPLVRGGKYEVFEGDNFPRTVIWEFPSYKAAIRCHESRDRDSCSCGRGARSSSAITGNEEHGAGFGRR